MSVESLNTNSVASVQPATAHSVDKAAKAEQQVKAVLVDTVATTEGNDQLDPVELDSAVAKLNDFVSKNDQRNISFSVDEDSGTTVVKVVDTESQQVIRQMPTEEALAVAKQIESMLGLIFNEQA